MTITEKAAYLRGFADAAKVDDELIKKIVEIIDDMAVCIADLDDTTDAIIEQLDAVDEDLGSLEEYVYDDDCDCCCDDDDCCCCDDDEDVTYELECPECGKTIYLDDSIFESDEDITCPACGAVLEDLTLDFDFEDEDKG